MTQQKHYRKLPIIVEAIQLSLKNWSEVNAFMGGNQIYRFITEDGEETPNNTGLISVYIDTSEDEDCSFADHGDWIIRTVEGKFYPCKPDIFAATYELVE
jgi:hypothetical protein